MTLTNISLISTDSKNFAILGSKALSSGMSPYSPAILTNNKSFLTSVTGAAAGDASSTFVDGLTEAAVDTELGDINTNFETIADFLGLAIS